MYEPDNKIIYDSYYAVMPLLNSEREKFISKIASMSYKDANTIYIYFHIFQVYFYTLLEDIVYKTKYLNRRNIIHDYLKKMEFQLK